MYVASARAGVVTRTYPVALVVPVTVATRTPVVVVTERTTVLLFSPVRVKAGVVSLVYVLLAGVRTLGAFGAVVSMITTEEAPVLQFGTLSQLSGVSV